MLLRKLLPVALAVAAVIGVTVGLSAALQSAPAAPPPKADPLPAAAPRIVAVVNNRLVRLDPDGKNSTPITPAGETVGHDARPRLSPDGSRVAYRVRPPGARANDPDDPSNLRLYVRRTDGTGSRTDLGRTAESYTWTPDGTALAVSTLTPPAAGRPEFGFEHAVVTVADAAAAPLRLPADQLLTDRTRDGTLYLTQSVVSAAREPDEFLRLALWRPDGTRHARVNPPGEMLIDGRLSPDDRRVLCLKLEPLAKRVGAEPYRLVVADVATGQTTRVASVPDDVGIHGYCWSPDGRRVAYARTRPARGGGSESALVACDPDGGNPRTLATGTSPTAGAVTVAGVDWR
ncbi:PD40 domain-containing protein [bacterium]|nr:PD40 domain-containing protein [bacterium]